MSADSAYPHEEGPYAIHGLTKRELIAAMAMQGYLSRPPAMTNESEREYDVKIARWSTDTADALLAELAKEPQA